MIQITRRPYEHNFTGNPIVYELFDNDAMGNETLSFQIKVICRRLDQSFDTELPVLTLSPFEARVKCDISSLLHTFVQHYLPPINNGPVSYSSGISGVQFYIHFRTISPTSINPAWATTELGFIRYGYKGGIHPFRFRGNVFFTQYLQNQKPFFTWQLSGRLVALTERIYLCWLNLLFAYLEPQSFLKLKVKVFFTDTTSADTEYNASNLQKGFMVYLPVGATELNLQALQPAKKIWYWECWLEDVSVGGLGIITEKMKFNLDNRNDYNKIHILYRNSTGGLDSMRVRGVVKKNIEHQATVIDNSASPDYVESDTLPALQNSSQAVEFVRYKVDIGHLTKEEQDRFRDALLNREAWMVKWGRWLPLTIITSGAMEFTTSDSMRWTLPIEFAVADSGSEHYTPDNVDLGTAEPASNTCSSSIVIESHTLFVNDPAPGLTRVRFNFAVVGAGGNLQWRVPGFVEAWQTIPFVASGYIDYAVSSDVEFFMEMRVVCSPGNYGPSVSHFADTDPAPPAENSTIYNETAFPSTYHIKVNGTIVKSGVVPAAGYHGFYFAPVVSASIELILVNIVPTEVELFIVDTIYLGAIAGHSASWTNKTTTIAGITLTAR